jgi:hypothetical protein
MRHITQLWIVLAVCLGFAGMSQAQVVDIPTRPGVTQRILIVASQAPKAAVILFAGGNGGLQITPTGSFRYLGGNFLIRMRQAFADQGLYVVVIDAPSDRQKEPFLGGFRQTPQHLEDVKAVIAYTRQQARLPVWLIGTSRGTQSVGHIATQLTGPEGPDGIVLTSTILTDDTGRAVPKMELNKIEIPVLAVHHRDDGCKLCAFANMPSLMNGLTASRRKELIAVTGGQSRGDPCEAQAYHGYNGIETTVVADIARWIMAN